MTNTIILPNPSEVIELDAFGYDATLHTNRVPVPGTNAVSVNEDTGTGWCHVIQVDSDDNLYVTFTPPLHPKYMSLSPEGILTFIYSKDSGYAPVSIDLSGCPKAVEISQKKRKA